MWEQLISELLRNHRGKLLGTLLGLAFALLVIFVGFLQTVFVACSIYIGYIIGKRVDDNESIRDVMERILKDR